MRFLGNTEAKTDAKGRVFLPVAFRKVLQASGEESLVLCKDLHQPCLVLYPESVWNEQMDALRNRLSRWNAAHQQLFRQFVSDVELVTAFPHPETLYGDGSDKPKHPFLGHGRHH